MTAGERAAWREPRVASQLGLAVLNRGRAERAAPDPENY